MNQPLQVRRNQEGEGMTRVYLKVELKSVTLGGEYGGRMYSGWWVWPVDMSMVAAGLDGMLFGPFDTEEEADSAAEKIVIEEGPMQ